MINQEKVHIVKTNRKEKFWFHHIRAVNYFCYRYWWLVLLAFFIYLILWFIFCFKTPYYNCANGQLVSQTLQRVNDGLDNCCDCANNNVNPDTTSNPPLYVPRENCRVHFSGLLMGGEKENLNVSKIYEEDEWSEYVGEGEYPDNTKAFPQSVLYTFDGIAIDAGTQLIIYSDKNFSGRILLDVKGPKIINNSLYQTDSKYNHCNTDVYPPALQKTYPQSVRIWSNGNMHDWSFGSCKIICSKQ